MVAVPQKVKKEDFDKVFSKRRPKKNLTLFIEDFLKSDADVAKVTFSDLEYKSARIAYGCIVTCARRDFAGELNVKLRNGEVYLVRT